MVRTVPRPLVWFLAAAVAIAAAVAGFLLADRRTSWTDPAAAPPPVLRAAAAFEQGRLEEGAAEIERFLEAYRAAAWEARARVLAAARLSRAGRSGRALDFLPRDLDPEEPLSAWASLARGRALLDTGRPLEAAEALRRALAARGFPEREEAARLSGIALERAGRAGAALALLDAEQAAALKLEAAVLAARVGDLDGARRRLAQLVLAGPPGEEAERALDQLSRLVSDPSSRFEPSERPLTIDTARRWVESGRARAAWELLESARPGAGTGALPPDEALLRAEILLRLGRLEEVPALLQRAAAGGGHLADGSAYVQARWHQARGEWGRYRRELAALARRPRRSVWVLRALLDLARLADGRPSREALAAYRRYREAARESADPSALWREAWIAHELGMRRESEQGFERVLARADAHDSVRLAALYWKARRLLESGRNQEARLLFEEVARIFPSHYYGLLATERLGLRLPPGRDEPVRPARLPEGHPAARWLEAARQLLSVSLDEEAWRAYSAAAAASSGPELRQVALEAADAALAREATAEVLRLVAAGAGDKDLIRVDELPARLWKVLLPLPHAEGLARAARERSLDPLLVASVALEESAFNPLAVSAAGAMGLLQLMPDTGAELARRLGIRGFRREHLVEPDTNLRLGCAYLRMLLDRHRSLPIALAAYHAGSSRASAWTVAGDLRDPERYVERIPIPDTRRYVKRILADLRLYQRVWGESLPGTGS